MPVAVERLPLKLTPDPSRVIMRFFGTGNEKRVRDIINRVLRFSESEVEDLLTELGRTFCPKHARLFDVFAEHYDMIRGAVPEGAKPTESRRLLLGARRQGGADCQTQEHGKSFPTQHRRGLRIE